MRKIIKRFLAFVVAISMFVTMGIFEAFAIDASTNETISMVTKDITIEQSTEDQTAWVTLYMDKDAEILDFSAYVDIIDEESLGAVFGEGAEFAVTSYTDMDINIPAGDVLGGVAVSDKTPRAYSMPYDDTLKGYWLLKVPVVIPANTIGEVGVLFSEFGVGDIKGNPFMTTPESVTATITISEPVDTSNPKFTVYYEIAAGTDTDTDNFKEIEPGEDVAVDVWVKADSTQTMQAFDIYPEWDTSVLTYKSIAAADGFTIVNEMTATDPHFQTNLAGNSSTDKTVGTAGVKVATMTLTFSENAVYDTEYSVWLDSKTNLAKAADAESVKNVTVTAEGEMGVETLNTYTVTYDANGGVFGDAWDSMDWTKDDQGNKVSPYQSKQHKLDLTLTSNEPTRDGHTFQGWTTVENPEVGANPEFAAGNKYTVDADDTLYAVWKLATANYTVVHKQQNLDGSAYIEKETETLSGNTGAATAAVAKPYEGFTAQTITQGTIAADGSTEVEILYDRNSYVLTWNDGTNKTTSEVKYGATIIKPADPSKTGYSFDNWDQEIPATMPAKDLTFNAVWTANAVTVILNANGGKVGDAETKEITVTYDGKYNNLTDVPAKEGYAFVGWYTQQTGGTQVTVTTDVTNANTHTLYARWEAITYVVKFNPGTGGKGDAYEQTLTYDKTESLSENLFTATDDSYAFAGWALTDQGEVAYKNNDSVLNLAKDQDAVINLYAVWKQNTISYVADPSGVQMTLTGLPETYNIGEALEITLKPTATGYTFNGWSIAALGISTKDNPDASITIPETATGNIELTAHWTINKYTITFDTKDGTAIEAITKNYGEAITAPDDPTRTGYTFAGWDKQIPATMPAEDMTITANWTINRYTVKFMDGFGNTISEIEMDYGAEVTAPADPTKTGYSFASWNVTLPTTVPASDLTITATWTENTYGITFDQSDDDVEYADTVTDQTDVKYTADVTLPTKDDVTKPGYELTGWTTVETPDVDDTVYNPGQTVSGLTPEKDGSVILYPVWTEATYELSFDLGAHPATDATVPNVVEVTYNGKYPELPTVTAAPGYEFKGWFIDVEDEDTKIEKDATVAITAKTTLTAKYEAIQYTITFDPNGGNVDPTTMTYDVETATLTLPTPTWDMHTFGGWYVKADSGSWVKDTQFNVTAGSYGHVEVYAKWTSAVTHEVEDYKYAPANYVMLRIATTTENTTNYTFGDIAMYYTADTNYLLNDAPVLVTLIPKNNGKTGEELVTYVSGTQLTDAGLAMLAPATGTAGEIDRTSGKINNDDVVNIADANAVYQMVLQGGSYYSLEQLSIPKRLMADMETAHTTGDARGTIEDVQKIVDIINGTQTDNS